MSFTKILEVDIRQGTLRRKSMWIFLFPFAVYGLYIAHTLKRLGISGTLGDYLMGCLQGTIPFQPEFQQDNYFRFPTQWLLIMLGCVVQCLSYPFSGLMTVGIQIMTRGGSRTKWWLAKCVWCSLQTIWYFFVGCGALILVCAIYGGTMELDLSPEFLQYNLADSIDVINLSDATSSVVKTILMMWLVSISLCLIQLMITLMSRPIIGFLTIVSILIISAIWFSPVAIGNYAMPIRMDVFLYNGLSMELGVMLCVTLSVACIYGGYLYVRKWDILSKC